MTTPNLSLLAGYAADLPLALAQINAATAVAGTVNPSVAAYVGSSDSTLGPVHQTLLTLSALPQTVVNGTEYQGTKVFTFPKGRILVLGVTATIAQTTTSDIASTLNSGKTGALALGTVVASNVALTSTMADLMPSTAYLTSTVINVPAAAVLGALVASAQFDGRATAKEMYVNTGYATTGDVDADATQTLAGTILVSWINLGP